MNGLLILSIAISIQAPEMTQVRSTDTTLSVTVSRSIRVAADRASMFVTVEGTGESPSGALTRTTQRAAVVQDTLRRFGSRITIGKPLPFNVALVMPQQSYPSQPQSPSYVARTLIKVSLSHIDDLGAVQASALAAGATTSTGFSFESSVMDSIWRSRISEATRETRAVAASMASEQGKTLGPLIDLNTGSTGGFNPPPQIQFDARYGSGSYAGVPEVVINANVTARYRLLPRP
jgi:uncharacterized protein YggE